MYKQIKKPEENKDRIIPQKQKSTNLSASFVDNRISSINQRLINDKIIKKNNTSQLYMNPIIQLEPEPMDEKKTEFNDLYKDEKYKLKLTKIAKNMFLLKGIIVIWDGKKYINLEGKEIKNIEKIKKYKDDVLDITQGEIGYIKNDDGPLKTIRSVNAHPCVIFTIHDAGTKQTMMAHIHRKNKIDHLLKVVKKYFNGDSKNIYVKLITKEITLNEKKKEPVKKNQTKSGNIDIMIKMLIERENKKKSEEDLNKQKEKKEKEKEEQERIRDDISDGITEYFKEKVNFEVDLENENAMINTSGNVEYPKNSDIESNIGYFGKRRAENFDIFWKNKEDNSQDFAPIRTANVMEEDLKILNYIKSVLVSDKK